MPRERWFYVHANRRMGPLARRELVEALLELTDPRTCLIWRRGLPAWTRAAEVPEIDRLLVPFAATEKRPPTPAPEAARPSVETPIAPAPRSVPAPRPHPGVKGRPRTGAPLYVAGAVVAVLVAGALVWSLARPRPTPGVRPTAAPGAQGTGNVSTPS